ncbi:DNA cytosine methyltransferase [Streptococcus macedonicus]|uniref:Cytosine-specific methyltransferase n=1 Tax=Streptococcus gallolyticus TaxID=315405 RepID=A0A380K507_9STRE|nr:DNA cytosine methyltransferase [Streptococcus macedonicus]WGK79557.1 DNA cytosine methyltransferase [Streptococcus macedonicus]SUN59310.1 putative cytosine-specific methyltransferase [Streptococcus gallolyticus]
MLINNIELFAGAGGLADGLEQSGNFNLLSAVEWMSPQVRTLTQRLKKKYGITDASEKVLNFDIQRTDELIKGWKDDVKFGSSVGLEKIVNNQSVDMISGGPPCQAYSLAGRIRDKNGMKDDYRNFLFESYIKIVNYFRPKIIVFENVEGILSAIPTGEKITDLIRTGFDNIGYEIVDDLKKHALLNLADFGVPQNRKRVIIIGIRRDNISTNYQNLLKYFYDELLPLKKSEIKTVRDAIADLPPIFPIENPTRRLAYTNDSNINGHNSRYHSERDKKIFNLLAEDIESAQHKYTSTDKLKELYFEVTGKNSNVHKYHVLRWDEPSNTIPAHLKKDGLRHIHPDPVQMRSITVREAARLQSFDDDFEFNESQMANFEMIGNAVPPLFAKKLGEVLPEFLDTIRLAEQGLKKP